MPFSAPQQHTAALSRSRSERKRATSSAKAQCQHESPHARPAHGYLQQRLLCYFPCLRCRNIPRWRQAGPGQAFPVEGSEESAKNSMQLALALIVDLGLLGPDGEGEDEAAADKDGAGMKSTVVRALQG